MVKAELLLSDNRQILRLIILRVATNSLMRSVWIPLGPIWWRSTCFIISRLLRHYIQRWVSLRNLLSVSRLGGACCLWWSILWWRVCRRFRGHRLQSAGRGYTSCQWVDLSRPWLILFLWCDLRNIRHNFISNDFWLWAGLLLWSLISVFDYLHVLNQIVCISFIGLFLFQNAFNTLTFNIFLW